MEFFFVARHRINAITAVGRPNNLACIHKCFIPGERWLYLLYTGTSLYTDFGVHKKSVLEKNSVIFEGLVHRRGKQWEPSLNYVITKLVL